MSTYLLVHGAWHSGRCWERVVPLLQHHYQTFIEQVPGESASGATPATYVMVAGYAQGEPFIVDIGDSGRLRDCLLTLAGSTVATLHHRAP